MRKNQLLLIIFGLLQLKVTAQSFGSLQQYYIGSGNTYLLNPIGSYQLNSGLYFEGRYNYEDVGTFSLYSGWTFEKERKLSYSISPMAGFVAGNFNGASVGANISFEYKRLSFFSSPQYTISASDRNSNFFYNWADLSLNISEGFSAGFSIQHTKSWQSRPILEKGILLEPSYKKWSFPLYIYNPLEKERYFVLGINFEWQTKKRKGHAVAPVIPPAPAVYPKIKPQASQPVERPSSAEVVHVKVAVQNVSNARRSAETATPPLAAKRAATAVQEYAIALGPFGSHEEAVAARTRIQAAFPVKITTGRLQLWLTGFASKKDAESFIRNNTFKDFHSSYSVVSYRARSVEVVTVK